MKTTDFIIKRKVQETTAPEPVQPVVESKPTFPEFDATTAESIFEAVLGGNKLGGPTSYKEFKDKEDYLLRQLSSPAQSDNYAELRQALGDLRRVAKERGIDNPQVSEDASVGGVSAGAVATVVAPLGGKPGTGKPKKVGNMIRRPKVTVGKGVY